MSFSVDELARIAIDLQSDIGHTDRFSRLITTLRQILGCDASALLRYEAHQFVPLAIDGLAKDVLGRRFTLETALVNGHGHVRVGDSSWPVIADDDLPAGSKVEVVAIEGITLHIRVVSR